MNSSSSRDLEWRRHIVSYGLRQISEGVCAFRFNLLNPSSEISERHERCIQGQNVIVC
jgi:hypothetical protein